MELLRPTVHINAVLRGFKCSRYVEDAVDFVDPVLGEGFDSPMVWLAAIIGLTVWILASPRCLNGEFRRGFSCPLL